MAQSDQDEAELATVRTSKKLTGLRAKLKKTPREDKETKKAKSKAKDKGKGKGQTQDEANGKAKDVAEETGEGDGTLAATRVDSAGEGLDAPEQDSPKRPSKKRADPRRVLSAIRMKMTRRKSGKNEVQEISLQPDSASLECWVSEAARPAQHSASSRTSRASRGEARGEARGEGRGDSPGQSRAHSASSSHTQPLAPPGGRAAEVEDIPVIYDAAYNGGEDI